MIEKRDNIGLSERYARFILILNELDMLKERKTVILRNFINQLFKMATIKDKLRSVRVSYTIGFTSKRSFSYSFRQHVSCQKY